MTTDLNSPHDRFFKTVFGYTDEVAAEFLQGYLPAAVAGALDWTTHPGGVLSWRGTLGGETAVC